LIANLLSVPLMGVLVMPAAVLAACLLPLGLEGIGLWFMGLGLRWILGVAHWVAGLEGARGTVVSPGPWVLPLIALGALIVILWQGRARFAGLAPIALGAVLWLGAARPDVLISDDGALVGVMTGEGRALSAPRGAGFVALNWLENDGDAALQEDAAARWDRIAPGAIPVVALRGKRAAEGPVACPPGGWLVLNVPPPEGLDCGAEVGVLHPGTLRDSGAVALYATPGGVRVVTARQVTGRRPWNDP
jgi:competence protein ComEC